MPRTAYGGRKNLASVIADAPTSFYISKKIQKMALLHILKFVTKMTIFLLLDIIFTKNDFWHYVYAKFHTFFVKYIFEKMSF